MISASVIVIVTILFFIVEFNAESINHQEQTIQNNDLLEQILEQRHPNHHHEQKHFFKAITIYRFLSKLIGSHLKTTDEQCTSRVFQSDVQVEMRQLRSSVSVCVDYCRIGVHSDGSIYGAKRFDLNSNLRNFVNLKLKEVKCKKTIFSSYLASSRADG